MFIYIYIYIYTVSHILTNVMGLQMFQISAMINFKTKFEGSSNRPCAKHNEEQLETHEEFVSDRASY